MTHIDLKDAKPGDLIFFHSTYDAGTYVTHVGIYAGENRMFHAGDPVGWTNLTDSYWQQHIIGAGRYKQ
ncbi:C40 family peptidase, partial [Enterococcus faecium]